VFAISESFHVCGPATRIFRFIKRIEAYNGPAHHSIKAAFDTSIRYQHPGSDRDQPASLYIALLRGNPTSGMLGVFSE